MRMQRIVSSLLIVALIVSGISISVSAVTSNAPKRVINLVYDDSGSMIITDIKDKNGKVVEKDKKVDTWCQAKYAIEVFASLMDDNDTLNIYVMSSYTKPKLVLKGSDGAEANVSKVHNMITAANNTPFGSVKQAYSDLVKTVADEKWLVVLTDGEFQNVDNIDAYFAQKETDIKVMFLGMGPQADGITPNEANNIFYKEAKNNSEILKQVTDISTQIFNSDRLNVNASSKTFSFDVPMAELVVFAQGANVKINGIKNSDGKLFSSLTRSVTVKYSDKPATNYSDFIISKDLLGSVATFKDDFIAGEYTIDVSGAETIEIYYKPNVEIAAYLKDGNGDEVTDLTDLEAGEYTIDFGFVKGGTSEKVLQSKLLGDVTYEAKVTNNGITHEKTYASGDKIILDEGSLSISVMAKYLDYNTVSTQLDYTIFKNKGITYEVIDEPNYTINSSGFEEIKPIVVKALLDTKEFTQEQWDMMGIPTVQLSEKQDFKMGDFIIKKTEELGIYHIYPSLIDEAPSSGTYSDCNFQIEYKEKHGNETWSGISELPIKMQDNRSWIERNRDLVIKLIILAIVLFIVLGYVPGIKKYLPSKLKTRPTITANPLVPGNEVKYFKGLLEKNIFTTIIPYIPQRGRIKFVPSGVYGVPKLELKATSGRRMILLNTRTFVGKDNITISGQKVPKNSDKLKLTAGSILAVTTPEWKYRCQLNTERNKKK